MSVQFPYYPVTPPSGYSCGQCGQWVPSGTFHSCGTATRWVNPPPPPPRTTDERIADALERLVAIFDKETHHNDEEAA